MGDWMDNLTPDERGSWDSFVDHVRKDAVHKIADSAFVMSLVPGGDPDIKFAVELGLAIMLDKPIVPVAVAGRDVPPGLRRVAHAVIELEHDMDTEAGQLEMQQRIQEVMEGLGLK
jgi:hypothetical protein